MNGIESTPNSVGIPRVAPPPPTEMTGSKLTRDNKFSAGHNASLKSMLTDALGASGFIDIAGGIRTNFRMLVGDRPDNSVDMDDLKPGMMVELVAWVASKLKGDAQIARNAQANVDPQRAISLLQ